jgi:predicted transcriptional regulator of viral defense system
MAEDQWGLFTRAQAETAGMAWSTLARMARNGRVERVARGVYRWAGVPPTELEALRAAWLQLAPAVPGWLRDRAQGVVSHRSAAAVLRLGELPADVHHFTLPDRRQTRRPDVTLHQAPLDDLSVTRIGGLLVTTAARTVADLVREHEDSEAVERIAAEAVQMGLATESALAEQLERIGRVRSHHIGQWLIHGLPTEAGASGPEPVQARC